ncbi:MAG: hypothetical protein BA870_02625 [Desulfuromonadales bacterium C00003094]|nr:MAG: hypothetical protein BA870_02625 [Desulfuromonadales bacterium C00003094]OEU72580.1 MAG: hypothetical protein BA869_01285 [Desulfuromonadales bacterium C00003107]
MPRVKYFKSLIAIVLVCILAGCSFGLGLVSPEQRKKNAESLARQHGWCFMKLPVAPFTLVAFLPESVNAVEVLTIYIEGDGLAWISSSQPSTNPTPARPVGLELALQHPRGVAVYLARPCQYVEGVDADSCSAIYWTDGRFAPELIDATDRAVDQLKQRFNASTIELVGYSGGGAIAALVAARRKDVGRLVTVAGTLDHEVWTRIHRVRPLERSLNPADAWQDLVAVPQLHFVGAADKKVPPAVAESYRKHFPENYRPEIRVINGFDHSCCWVENWAKLYPTN